MVPRPEGTPHVSSRPANETDMPTQAERLAGLPSDSVSPLLFSIYYHCVYMMRENTCSISHMWKSEDNSGGHFSPSTMQFPGLKQG